MLITFKQVVSYFVHCYFNISLIECINWKDNHWEYEVSYDDKGEFQLAQLVKIFIVE